MPQKHILFVYRKTIRLMKLANKFNIISLDKILDIITMEIILQ